MSTKDTKAEWEAVLESLTNESKKRKLKWYTELVKVLGRLAGLGIYLYLDFLHEIKSHANRHGILCLLGRVGIALTLWFCVVNLHAKLAIQNSFNLQKEKRMSFRRNETETWDDAALFTP